MGARSLYVLQKIVKQRKSSLIRPNENSRTEQLQQSLILVFEWSASGHSSVVESRATSNMIMDGDMFVSLDENFKGSVGNANFSESKISGKGELRFIVKMRKASLR